MTTRAAAGALMTSEQAEAIRGALKSSLYPGASDASIEMVLSYCQAAGLDPMTKPVHIVPMKVKIGENPDGTAVNGMRDVVMPGIGLYRINASRTGQYAGCSEPEFGPTCTMESVRDVWSDGPNGRRQKTQKAIQLHYPEWCRVTVRKLLGNQVVEFSAKEYWLENYASKSDGSPNAMWEKRAFGQLAKCAEAQALRKAFPEAVGSQPTAEEMEGKEIIEGESARGDRRPPAGVITRQVPAEPEDTEERRVLYAHLQEFAETGMAEYQGVWGRLTKEQRQMIGTSGHEALKAVAERADVVDAEPKQDAAGEEVPL
ncbi:phage recombination protein Bet [Stenotrophomonas maltophilia]|uniref:Phage recombination protein Bet n=2 Tax=Stenotrophomonas maltophilia TaxID=40324 RepID=A0A4S2D398_STEMA|nr:phage recombination protein Bet [Stenotrophomonas maltophilia]